MNMNETPSANRVHIGIFGRRNVGKSSIINAITGQNLAIVSDVKGTTTDPVSKAMELLPLGPVVLIDTPGLDDEGELGKKRMEKSYQVLNKTDIAVLVLDGTHFPDKKEFEKIEKPLLKQFRDRNIPYVITVNKSENLTDERNQSFVDGFNQENNLLFISAKSGINIQKLKDSIANLSLKEKNDQRIVGDLLKNGDIVVLVIPIDSSAPKGRLILPQQQVIRDCLESGAIPVVTRDTELNDTLHALVKKPKVVITDSQAFQRVSEIIPDDMFLTSFSILFSRYKGNLMQQVSGAKEIRTLKEKDVVLISEGCTHHRQCEDIGTVKMPRWIKNYTEKEIEFQFTSGTQFPVNLKEYALIVHCGGCTLNEREMKYRLKCAREQKVPITNYGLAIAEMNGILDRSLMIFQKHSQEEL